MESGKFDPEFISALEHEKSSFNDDSGNSIKVKEKGSNKKIKKEKRKTTNESLSDWCIT